MVHHSLPDNLDDAKMVVAGTRGMDINSLPACPVVLVPENLTDAHRARPSAEIALGVDAHEPATGAIECAFETARLWGVRLRAVHAWRLPSHAAELPYGVPEEDRGAWEDTKGCSCWRTGCVRGGRSTLQAATEGDVLPCIQPGH
ncbi:universal stress protein [Streptomyces lanatus]|uniref:Universal stress protein n=1 Tax=Streptomyces lanatus TaxID=66900 RepID=A0ABV1XL34_9ACTN|nr:universal stress protein [Streptomyces lanatus]GHG97274.1 hypothetical protein GCM10018780_22490 [Streptomyces lanatus]